METFTITTKSRGGQNPFLGKIFKKVTYNKFHEQIFSETLKIESQEELTTAINEVKQFNIDHETEGHTQKLITE